MRIYKEVKVRSKPYGLSLELYRLSRAFPREELHRITSQMRRAAVPIAANHAKGRSRRTYAEMARFVRISMGSASELDHHLLLCKDLGFWEGEDYKRTSKGLVEIRKMPSALPDSIERELEIRAKATAHAKGQGLMATRGFVARSNPC